MKKWFLDDLIDAQAKRMTDAPMKWSRAMAATARIMIDLDQLQFDKLGSTGGVRERCVRNATRLSAITERLAHAYLRRGDLEMFETVGNLSGDLHLAAWLTKNITGTMGDNLQVNSTRGKVRSDAQALFERAYHTMKELGFHY